MLPGTSPTVLLTLAVTGGTPNARRVGNVINVPDPTTVLMVPAATPARATSTASSGLMRLDSLAGGCSRVSVVDRLGGGRRRIDRTCGPARAGGALRRGDRLLHRLAGRSRLRVVGPTR